jgi:hypothetical protein
VSSQYGREGEGGVTCAWSTMASTRTQFQPLCVARAKRRALAPRGRRRPRPHHWVAAVE